MAAVRPYEAILPSLIRIIQNEKDHKFKHKGYEKAVNHAEEMAVHLYGVKPVALLERVRPREDPAITAYRLQSYEPTTTSTAGKALTICNKIFNPKLFGAKPGEGEQGEQLFQYMMVEYPVFNSVIKYLSEFGMKKNMSDPNGVFLVEPSEIPYIQDGPEIRVDVTKQILPIITAISSKDVWIIRPEYGLFFVKIEEVKNPNNGTVLKLWYFKYVDKNVVDYFYIYTNDSKNYLTQLVSAYDHKFGVLPFWFMGGDYDQEVIGLFCSYFYPAVPFWNKAISAQSDLDGALVSHMHPQKWEVAEECEFEQETDHGIFACNRGYLYDPTVRGGKTVCPRCEGSGRKSVKGPHSQYWVTRDKLVDPSGNLLSQPPAGYIDVPTAPTELLDRKVKEYKEEGLSALNMDIVNEIGNNQSGDAKSLDRSELFDFLGKVRDLFFDKHLVNIGYFFAKYMFIGKSDKEIDSIEPLIIKPNDFDILTTSELMEQIKVGKDSNINSEYIRAKTFEVNNKEFQNHPDQLVYLNLVNALQPYAGYSPDQIDLMVYRGTVPKIDVIIHDNIDQFVRRALEENTDFAVRDYTEQMEILRGYAEEKMEEIQEESKIELEAAQEAMIQPDNVDPNKPDNDAE